MPLRLLLLALFLWVAWRLYKKLVKQVAAARAPEQFEPMAQCAACGTYLPARDLGGDGRCRACRG